MTRSVFGVLPDGRNVELVTVRNKQGIEATVITYGATIVSLKTADSGGVLADIVLGHDAIGGYLDHSPYFGAVVGRYANRIADGGFPVDGIPYEVSRNEGTSCLHGGTTGFDKAIWEIAALTGDSVQLLHTSRDGDEGFPGELRVAVIYTLTDSAELVVEYHATTSAPTVINLTQHSYWNLSGAGNGSVLDHELTIAASRFTPVDAALVPTGEMRSVEGTPFDFRVATPIGERIGADDQQLGRGHGYDHNFVLDSGRNSASPAARLVDPRSGRTLEVFTSEPGLQLYTGNRLDGSIAGKDGLKYERHGGVCLETQHFPDSPNRPDFPSTVLRPGEAFRSRTVFAFGTVPFGSYAARPGTSR